MTDRESVRLPDGKEISLRRAPSSDAERRVAHVLSRIAPATFDCCPICLDEEATSLDHVPPQSIGGTDKIGTCEKCNNDFGTLEAALEEHHNDAARGVRFRNETIEGERRGGRIQIRWDSDETFVVAVDGRRLDPAVQQMLESGHVELECAPPNRAWWLTALLKHSYLAACMTLGHVPTSLDSEGVRAELLAARDDRSMLADGPGQFAQSLKVLRVYEKTPYPLGCAVADIDGTPLPGFVLGDFGFVSWPIPDIQPKASLPRSGSLDSEGDR